MTRHCASTVRCRPGGTIHGVVGQLLAAFVVALVATLGMPRPGLAQDVEGWTFASDPFADLWFHGLAIVGFDGFGRVPLYDAEYAWEVASASGGEGGTPTSALEQARGELLTAFVSDPVYEVLHFVPLYFTDAPVDMALDALEHLGETGTGRMDARVAREAAALAAVLPTARHRATVATFVRALREERSRLARRGRTGFDVNASEVADLWTGATGSHLHAFLKREGFTSGTVVIAPALGVEGRFRSTAQGPLVMVGPGSAYDSGGIVAAVIRELCYPTVRRVMAPYESRFEDRHLVSDVSDLAATRCGELLLEQGSPRLLAALRARFDVPASGAGFLSAAGVPPGVAAFEGELDAALVRELHLNQGSDRGKTRPAGR